MSKFLIVKLAFEPETIVYHRDTQEEATALRDQLVAAENWDYNVYEIASKDGVPVNTG